MNTTAMELKLILDTVLRSASAVENAMCDLEIWHRDLMKHAEWIKEKIRKTQQEVME